MLADPEPTNRGAAVVFDEMTYHALNTSGEHLTLLCLIFEQNRKSVSVCAMFVPVRLQPAVFSGTSKSMTPALRNLRNNFVIGSRHTSLYSRNLNAPMTRGSAGIRFLANCESPAFKKQLPGSFQHRPLSNEPLQPIIDQRIKGRSNVVRNCVIAARHFACGLP